VPLRELKGNRVIIWRSYIEAKSRSKGRRVREKACGKFEELFKAAEQLGLQPQILQGKQYPRDRRLRDAIEVNKVRSKSNTLRLMCAKVAEGNKET
jgi:signal recognition particle subunit SEC65